MLIVSRKDAESIEIRPGDDIDPSMTLADLFSAGPIEITIFSSNNNRVKMGVQAPQQLSIWRTKNSVIA
jgi:sRNA-binding carbon storage regulator CsrA